MLLLYFLLFYIYYPNKRHAKKVLYASTRSSHPYIIYTYIIYSYMYTSHLLLTYLT